MQYNFTIIASVLLAESKAPLIISEIVCKKFSKYLYESTRECRHGFRGNPGGDRYKYALGSNTEDSQAKSPSVRLSSDVAGGCDPKLMVGRNF